MTAPATFYETINESMAKMEKTLPKTVEWFTFL